MKLDVSLGEAIDKLNILELKNKKIEDYEKCQEIQKEIDYLSDLQRYKSTHVFFYNLLTFVNEFIWDTTNIIKTKDVADPSFATLSNDIFLYNQKRFRIKNWFNMLEQSDIKEQKSYGLTHVYVDVLNESILYEKIAEINFLLLEYDIVYFTNSDENFVKTIKKIFKQPNIYWQTSSDKAISLEQFTITENKSYFEFIPIHYFSGGLLGDFIHQLSVVKEKFLETGRKGNVYINNIDNDHFRLGVETAYRDTYKMITEQNYINSYKIYNGEPFDIHLSDWRHSPLLYKTNWYKLFQNHYNVEWGTHPWLSLPKNDLWKDKIIINYSTQRPIKTVDFVNLYKKYGNALLFMGFEKEGYNHLIYNYSIPIEYVRPSSLYDFAVAIQSCRFFVGGFSLPLAIAFALHAPHVIGNSINIDSVFFKDLENIIQNQIQL